MKFYFGCFVIIAVCLYVAAQDNRAVVEPAIYPVPAHRVVQKQKREPKPAPCTDAVDLQRLRHGAAEMPCFKD